MARPALQTAAGVHEVVGAGVLREVRDHRPHDRELVDTRSDVRKQVTDGDAALAVAAELPGALEHIADVVELRWVGLDLDRLSVLAIEPGLGVERIELRRAAVHKKEDDAACPGRELRGPGARGLSRLCVGSGSGSGACAARTLPKASSRKRTAAARAPKPPPHRKSMSRRLEPGPRNRWQCIRDLK